MKFTLHHTAISVRDLSKTVEFYSVFGFKQVHRYDDEDKTGVKLKLNDYVLEIFAYKSNQQEAKLELSLGNNLSRLGVKHIGFSVDNVDHALADLKAEGLADDTTKVLQKGTARFFFIMDPDGMWVEVIRDDRY